MKCSFFFMEGNAHKISKGHAWCSLSAKIKIKKREFFKQKTGQVLCTIRNQQKDSRMKKKKQNKEREKISVKSQKETVRHRVLEKIKNPTS